MKTIISLSQSQISEFLRCPQLWNLHTAQNWGKPEQDERYYLDEGTIVHAFLEHYYRDSTPLGNIPSKFTGEVKEIWRDFDVTDKYKERPAHLTKDFLFERIKLYVMGKMMRGDWRARENGVEVGFSTVIYEDDQFVFVIEGRIDLITTDNCIVDHKTQSRWANLYMRKVQFVTYAMATGLSHVIANYIMLTKEVNAQTFRTDLVSFSKAELEYWKNYLIEWVFWKIARWEIWQNHGACGGTYDSWPCMFEKVCWEQNEEMRARILRHNFVKIEEHRSW